MFRTHSSVGLPVLDMIDWCRKILELFVVVREAVGQWVGTLEYQVGGRMV